MPKNKNPDLITNGKKIPFKRIMELGSDKIAVLNSYLLSETYTTHQIIDILQKEWKVFQGVSQIAMYRQLMRYKKEHVLPKQARIANKFSSNRQAKSIAETVERLEKKLNVVGEMEFAVNLQLARVKKLQENEDNLPTLMDAQTKNIAVLSDMLVKLGNLQMDLGILKKVPAKLNVGVTVTDEDQKFVEEAKLLQAENSVTVEAFKYLKENNLVSAPKIEDAELVEDDPS